MTAVMLVSMTAGSNAERVAEAALSRMEFYEREGTRRAGHSSRSLANSSRLPTMAGSLNLAHDHPYEWSCETIKGARMPSAPGSFLCGPVLAMRASLNQRIRQ
jgi:hypothetical protein